MQVKDQHASGVAARVLPDSGEAGTFSEVPAWREVGTGWQPLHGGFRGAGYSIEWHDFMARRELDWARSFHPGGIELCLNLEGEGFVQGNGERLTFSSNTAGFYRCDAEPLTARRMAGQRHRFLTVEFTAAFLERQLAGAKAILHPLVRAALDGNAGPVVALPPARLTTAQQQLVASLRQPPVYAAAQPVWSQCKATEMAVTFLIQPLPEAELFCTRQHRLAQERVAAVRARLQRAIANPPSLEELGREIGCSHFYLSRIFSTHTGQTIPQYLRQLRMDRAAELLRAGRFNVTEVALEVGYSSLSHFSQVFQETFGCCPGLYPLATSTQKPVARLRKLARRQSGSGPGDRD
ncbi:MAG TPA: helix-turn-helix domain-containing protein [Verrucomicrobiota bacterium]|jgi:AraC-like DNA-binding protein|nr:MAG: Regulatory protein SoxS [Verrucomicrobia bacterium ADurb.Bin118]HPY29154.1 helix-turn-helix domain-containing protein [Verrucomicrobiota bacterium]HQB17292.1 helix-turn-helix domain-containing protein [Verrucomicrobiota bacterium]